VRAGLLAAAVGAIYGPFVFFVGSLLRDWLPPILDPLLILALLRAHDSARPRDWILAGLLFGGCVLVKSSILLFLPLAVVWIAWESRSMRSIAFLAAGLAIGIAPLVARNLAVGAPAFADRPHAKAIRAPG
jgi:4-amino-4-deoxy-L-arabinose transferase-like glycosyltransferase